MRVAFLGSPSSLHDSNKLVVPEKKHKAYSGAMNTTQVLHTVSSVRAILCPGRCSASLQSRLPGLAPSHLRTQLWPSARRTPGPVLRPGTAPRLPGGQAVWRRRTWRASLVTRGALHAFVPVRSKSSMRPPPSVVLALAKRFVAQDCTRGLLLLSLTSLSLATSSWSDSGHPAIAAGADSERVSRRHAVSAGLLRDRRVPTARPLLRGIHQGVPAIGGF